MADSYHIKRLAAPKTWPIQRKKAKWIAKPMPGVHTLQMNMPLQIYITDILQLANSKSEVKKILNQGLITVNSKIMKEPRFGVGLFDTLKVSKYKKNYRVLLNNKGQLQLSEISEQEADLLLTRVEGKTIIKKGKTQVRLSNGWTFVADKDVYKTGDMILFNTKESKVAKHLKMEKGRMIYVVGGVHAGTVGKIKNFAEEGILRKKKFVLAQADSEELKVPLQEVFVVGEDKPEIRIQ